MEEANARGARPVLWVAAESIAVTLGAGTSVAEVAYSHALAHYGVGLRQYLAVRLGSRTAADGAFEALRARLAGFTATELAADPGPRAHLYRLARELWRERGTTKELAALELGFLRPPDNAPASYVAALARARRELSSADAELLELRYARELSPGELCHVMGEPLEVVITALDDAAKRAARLLGPEPPSRLGGLRGALHELFALAEPSASAESRHGQRRALPPGTLIGERYAVDKRVGDGSFGDVYRAFDADVPGHVVALKILHKAATSDDARKSALRELRLIASVFHPSVVNFKDHGWHHDRLWFVMPWYEGETLEERIRRAPLTRAEAERIFVPLARALATMHESGIRHQDIKPDNIFLAHVGKGEGNDRETLPVLIDLGVAAKEAEMIVAGTPLYFPPEIAAQYAGKQDKPKVTTKADVFSLALALRNALEPSTQDQVPGTAIEAFIAHRAEQPPPPPGDKKLAYLAPFFERWLSHDAEQRPSAAELANELSVLTLPERKSARRKAVLVWAAPLASFFVLALSSTLYVYIEQRHEARAAKQLALVTHQELDRESALRKGLEVDVQHGELTKQQLERRLEERVDENQRLYTQLTVLRKDNADMAGRLHTFGAELDGARRDREASARKLEAAETRAVTLENQLFSTEHKRAFAESELREVRTRMTAAEGELEELRRRSRTLLGELDRARTATENQLERVAELEVSLGAAQRDRARLERELDDARTKQQQLEKQTAANDHTPSLFDAL
jgi:eukaryotic-like serine/threonine-protein kinase